MLSEVADCATANTYIKIFMGAANAKEAKLAQEIGHLTEDQARRLPTFQAGEAIIVGGGLPEPQYTRFDFEDLGRYPSEEEVGIRQAEAMARLKAEIIYAPAEEQADSISYQELDRKSTRLNSSHE